MTTYRLAEMKARGEKISMLTAYDYTMAGIMEMIARTALAFLVPVYGFTVARFASPAAWILADLFLIPAYFWCARHVQYGPAPRRRPALA